MGFSPNFESRWPEMSRVSWFETRGAPRSSPWGGASEPPRGGKSVTSSWGAAQRRLEGWEPHCWKRST